MLDALVDFNANQDPASSAYGKQVVLRGEAALIIYRILELGEEEQNDVIPEHEAYLENAQQTAGWPINYNVDQPMGRGDLVGLAMRLMKNEGCLDYADNVANPFANIPDGYEYIPELMEAQLRGIIRNGEGNFSGAPGTWVFRVDAFFDRRGGAIWLYRILREAFLGGACREKQDCWTLYQANQDEVHFAENDFLALKNIFQATCDYVLGGLPLATVGLDGLIDTDFEGVAEAEETLVTIYRMLQVTVD
jgi:hypothetical protein